MVYTVLQKGKVSPGKCWKEHNDEEHIWNSYSADPRDRIR